MHMRWGKPHDLFKRLIQCLVVIIITVLIGLIIDNFGMEYSVPSLLTFEPETLETVMPESLIMSTETESTAAETEKTSESEIKETEIKTAAPYANPEETSVSLLSDLIGIIQLQPNYLPDLSLNSMTWDQLEAELNDMIDGYSGEWSVYIKDLSNDEVISINDKPMDSASLIKLYIMGAVLEQINNGTLEETTSINTMLMDMIMVSDNTAANDLVKLLSPDRSHREGTEIVNSFAARHGFLSTEQYNGLNDSSLVVTSNKTNHTSAKDCGEFLAAVYDGKLVSHLASRKMENMLMSQEITYKIPTGLPSGVISANKTGETDTVENDSAIIYSKGGDFILCLMSENWDDKNQAVSRLRALTKVTYRYFNPEEN